MQKLIFPAVAYLGLAVSAPAQDARGTWSGLLHGDKSEHVVLRIVGTTGDQLRAALYLSDRGADLAVDDVVIDGGELRLRSSTINLTYKARLSADGNTMSGTWDRVEPYQLNLTKMTENEAWASDSSPHQQSKVQVEEGVSVEVLDWGGNGPPVLLLAGLGNNAHVFDTFAPKLRSTFHVYAMTRRGFGSSTWPTPGDENYTATRLGKDVLAAIRWMKLKRPLLVGHSIAGEELSYVGTQNPQAVRGLIYLEAAYDYAFFDEKRPDFTVSLDELRRKLAALRVTVPPQQLSKTMQELSAIDLPRFQGLVAAQAQKINKLPKLDQPQSPPPPLSAIEAIINGEQEFEIPKCPVLAIFAVDGDPKINQEDSAALAAADPAARVVSLKGASHYIFVSNEADVLNEIESMAATR